MKITTGLEPEWIKTDEAEYLCRPLTSAEYIDAIDEMSERFGTAIGRVCKLAVQDWQKVNDDNDKPVKFETSLIERLPPNELSKLSGLIIKASKFSEEEKKN